MSKPMSYMSPYWVGVPPAFGLRNALAWVLTGALLVLAVGQANRFSPAVTQANVAAAKDEAQSSRPAPVAAPTLGVRMRHALDYTSRRYRLSAAALEPIFVAAELAAKERGLDPLLVIAVIGIESSFNPLAQSVAGAQGLMQIIPRFHADKLPPEKRSGAAEKLALFDPATNIHVGTQALHEYIRAGGGVAEGLQQFAGATGDPERGYTAKVLAELERLGPSARPARPLPGDDIDGTSLVMPLQRDD